MPYLGRLQRGSTYVMEVQTVTPFALTVLHVRRDRLAEVEVLQFDATSITERSIGSGVDRVVFLASAPVNSSAVVKLSQGTSLHEVRADTDALITFDVIP